MNLSTEDTEMRCVKCESQGVIRVTGMEQDYQRVVHIYFCCNPMCGYQRERAKIS